MSGYRISSRVLEKENLIRKQQELKEEAELLEVKNNIEIFYSACNESIPLECCDFELPTCWKVKPIQKRKYDHQDESSSDEEDSQLNIPHYRVLKQNLYRAPLQRIVTPIEETPCCDCNPRIGCGMRCQNRLLYMECAPGQCPSLASSKYCEQTKSTNLSYRSRQSQRETEPETDMKTEPEVPISTENGISPEQEEYCLNTAIQTRTFPAVEVFLPTMDQSVEVEVADSATERGTGGSSGGGIHSSSRKRARAVPPSPPVSKGLGLRILEPVRRGTIIVEYLGEVITAAEGLRRMGQYTASDAFYFAGLDNGLLLDAKAMGSVARFANHSCDPSCVLQKWTVHGECRLVLAAGRDLRAGDEITYNYHYFDDSLEGMRGMRRQVCLCGARNCCGTIGGRVLSTSAVGNEENTVQSWSVRDIHERCVALQLLLPYTENEDEEKVERGSVTTVVQTNTDVIVEVKPDPDSCMTTENTTTSIDRKDIETTPEETVWNNSSTSSDLPQRRHTSDTLQTLLTDIEGALTTAALEGPQQKTRFFSPATHLIPSLTNCAHRIRETLRLSELWLQNYTVLFRADTLSVSLPQAQELLSQAPGMVRLSEVTQLDTLIKTALKAERMLDTLLNKVSTVTNTSTESTTIKNTTTRSLQWSEVVTTAKALQAALPILCSVVGVKKLLQAYEQSAVWARHLLGPVLSVGKQHKEKTTTNSTIPICTNKGSGSNEEYAVFQRLLDAYFLSSPSELSCKINKTQSGKREELPFTLFYPLLSDGFIAAEWLEDRLTTYIEREQQETVLHKRQTLSLSSDIHIISSGTSSSTATSSSGLSSASHSSTNLVVDSLGSKLSESTSLFSPTQPCIRTVAAALNALITQHTTDNDSATIASCSGSGGPETLYCFCRLPEDDGESTVLSQCALCYNWYHPHCVNAITTTLTAASRQKEFTCPVCMHLQNTPSRFASAPESEWAHVRATKPTPGTASTTGSNKSASVGKYNTVKTTASRINKSKNVVASQQTEAQDDPTELSIPVSSNLINTKRHPSRSAVSVCTPGSRTTTSTTSTTTTKTGYTGVVKLRPVPAVKARDFVTLAEVDAALLKEATLLSTGSPTALLVRLARGYLTTWQQHCTTFLTSCTMSETLQLLKNHITSAITGHIGKNMITTEALVQQTRVLQRTLELYFHPRLIRIRDETLCLQLRQLAWIISTSTLLRCVVHENNLIDVVVDLVPQIPSESSHNFNTILFPRSLLSLSELTSIVAGGASLFTTATFPNSTITSSSTYLLSIAELGASLLQWLRQCQDKTRALLAQAVQCRSCVEAPALVTQLQTVASQGVVYVHTEFGFAVVSCLSRRRVAVAAALPDGSIVASSTAALNTLPGELSDIKHSNTISASGSATASVPTATATVTVITTERSEACLSKSSSEDMLIVEVPTVTSDSSTENETADGAYCWCRGADDGSAMVSCDCCDEWFHCTCVGLRSLRALTTTTSTTTSSTTATSSNKSSKNKSKQQKNIQATYICISCTILTGTEYVYKW